MKGMNAEEVASKECNITILIVIDKHLTTGWSSFQVSPCGSQPLGDGRDYELQHQGMVMLPMSPTPT
jgi:hypothetical protein